MFCPSCGVEYRPGFTRCNDCDVDLVYELPSEEEAAAAEGAGGEESLELLWRGTHGGIFNTITAALEEAGIRSNRENLDARLTLSSGYAPLEVWVRAAEMEAARKVLEETLAQISQPIATAEMAGSAGAEEGQWAEMPGFAEEPHPEDATAEVWSGGEEAMAQFLKSCLAANGIGCHIDKEKPKAIAVRVLPEDEARSREIVRQVVEGNPPE